MPILLNPIEARLIGCLIEKAITMPDQYPLSLNALTNACNQKSNRDPLMELEERAVQAAVDGLIAKHLILERSGFGSRVPKYQHRFCNTGFGTLEFSPLATSILCELLLRGPQTPGELKSRTALHSGGLGANIDDASCKATASAASEGEFETISRCSLQRSFACCILEAPSLVIRPKSTALSLAGGSG